MISRLRAVDNRLSRVLKFINKIIINNLKKGEL